MGSQVEQEGISTTIVVIDGVLVHFFRSCNMHAQVVDQVTAQIPEPTKRYRLPRVSK